MIRMTAFFVCLSIASALGVVTAQHKARRLVTAIEREQVTTRNLQDEWGRLDIEQQAVAALPAVEKLARKALHMDSPSKDGQISLELSQGGVR